MAFQHGFWRTIGRIVMDLVGKAKAAKVTAGSRYHRNWWDGIKEDHPKVAIAICELVIAWKNDELPAFKSRRKLINEVILPNLPDDAEKATVNWLTQQRFWDAQVCRETLAELRQSNG